MQHHVTRACRLRRTDWASAKGLLGDANFLKRLYDYDKDNIPEKLLRQLKKYIDNPKFVPDIVEKTSKVCFHSILCHLLRVTCLCLHF